MYMYVIYLVCVFSFVQLRETLSESYVPASGEARLSKFVMFVPDLNYISKVKSGITMKHPTFWHECFKTEYSIW